LSTSYDETIKIWDSTDGSMSLLMKHPVFAVETRWEQSGEKILSGGWDDQVIVWNARNGEPYAKLGTGHESIYSCSWTADGCRFAITSLSGELEVWDAGFSRRIMVIKDTTSHFVSCLMSRDGLSVLTSNSNHHLELWSVPNGQRLLFFRANTSYAQKIDPDGSLRHTLPYDQCCVISNDGKRILHATPEAWRWLGWEERDAKGRFIRRLPAEAFGPIPGMDD
jgi:WD40 repeat protein